MIEIPAKLMRNHSEKSADWLAGLPGDVDEYLGRWDLTVAGEPLSGEASLILPVVRRDGTEAMLKLQQVNDESEDEALALRTWNHDDVVEVFEDDPATSTLLLERLEPRTLDDLPDHVEATRILADVREEIDQVREQGLRQASHMLHPAVISVGLAPAVRSLMARYEDGFASTLQVDERLLELDDAEENLLPEPLRLTAYRVLEEILANVYRHAQASQVTVRLGVDSLDQLSIVVKDDGCGFDTRSRRRGLGLVSIAGRVGQVGGSWSIDSAPGAGTTVAVALPLLQERTVAGSS